MITPKGTEFLLRMVYTGAPVISLALMTGAGTDPVNLPKYIVLVSLGIGIWAILLSKYLKFLLSAHRACLVAVISFIFFGVVAVLFSESPITQNLYGVYGRNSGLFTYLSLSSFFLASLLFKSEKNFIRLLAGFLITGIVNVLYCAWVLAFGDFIPWNNEYGEILGFLGNPNFIGAFLGMLVTYLFAIIIQKDVDIRFRLVLIVLGLVTAFEIQASKAIQGKVVAATGISFVVYCYLKFSSKTRLLSRLFGLGILVLGAFSIAGALQKGPLVGLIYKKSVSLRGSYWNAGLEMGKNHPFTGVGMDSYIDWYRTTRSVVAATYMPGPNIVTNTAHNVPIDIFSYGGFPLLFAYIALMIFGLKALFQIFYKSTEFKIVPVSLSAIWIGYQVQSFVSINQIGLAVWGWIFTGALIAYERQIEDKRPDAQRVSQPISPKKTKASQEVWSPQLVGGIGVVIGLLVALPPLNADLKWRSALVSKNLEKVEQALTPSLFNPSNSSKYLQAYPVFIDSQLPVQARKYTLEFIKFNPRSFEAWKCLYSLASSSDAEKAKALRMMKILDPNNPDVTSIQ